jgi:hypothetical protein
MLECPQRGDHGHGHDHAGVAPRRARAAAEEARSRPRSRRQSRSLAPHSHACFECPPTCSSRLFVTQALVFAASAGRAGPGYLGISTGPAISASRPSRARPSQLGGLGVRAEPRAPRARGWRKRRRSQLPVGGPVIGVRGAQSAVGAGGRVLTRGSGREGARPRALGCEHQ